MIRRVPCHDARRRVAFALAFGWMSALGARPFVAGAPTPAEALPVPTVQQSHAGEVEQLVFSADGSILASSSLDEIVEVWEVSTGRTLQRLPGPVSPRSSTRGAFALSSDGAFVLVAGEADEAVLFDTATGREVRRFHAGTGQGVESVAFAAGGKTVVAATKSGDVLYFPLAGARKPRVVGSSSPASTALVRATADGNDVISGGGTQKTRRFSAGGVLIGEHAATGGDLIDIAVSRDGLVLVTASTTGVVSVFDDKRQRTGSRKVPGVRDIDVTPDGARAVVVDDKGALSVFETGSDVAPVATVPDEGRTATAVAFAPDGRAIAVGDKNGGIRLLSLAGAGAVAPSFDSKAASNLNVSISADGGLIAVLDNTFTVHVWSIGTGAEVRRLPTARGLFALAPDGSTALVGAPEGGGQLVDVFSGEVVRTFTGQADPVSQAAFTADGRTLVTGGDAGHVAFFDVSTGRLVSTFRAHEKSIKRLVLAERGGRMLTVSADLTACVWTAATAALVHRFVLDAPLRSSPGRRQIKPGEGSVDLSPDGTRILLRTKEQEISVLSATGAILSTLPRANKPGDAHVQPITSARFSPSGKLVATTSWDQSVRVWDAESGALLARFTGHLDDTYEARFTHDERHVVSVARDRTVRIWSVEKGVPRGVLASFDGPRPSWCVFDTDGRFDKGGDATALDAHWVLGVRTFELDALADRFYDPQLLPKLLGWSSEPLRSTRPRGPITPPPTLLTQPPTAERPTLKIDVESRGGGGIGRIAVDLNGKRITDSARGDTIAPGEVKATVEVDLSKQPVLLPGQTNRVQVTAHNAANTTSTRGPSVTFEAPGTKSTSKEVWALVCGVSEYRGEALRLRYSAKDAQDMAAALALGAEGLVGKEHTHVTLLSSPVVPGAGPATLEGIRAAFAEIQARAQASDVLVVYLAGHGLVHGEDRDYHYLLADAESGDLRDEAVRQRVALSGRELARLIRGVHTAGGQLLLLDTCAAGRVGPDLKTAIDTTASPGVALNRLREETGAGIFVLAGCAADRVSYESGEFGQGLLTYSLLSALSCGCHFRDADMVDVSRLLDFAGELVVKTSMQLGLRDDLRQRALKFVVEGSTFDIGRLTAEERARIPVQQPRPVFVRSSFQRKAQPRDNRLQICIDAAVRDVPPGPDGRPPIVLIDGERMKGAYALDGVWEVVGGTAKVTARLSRLAREGEDENLGDLEVAGPAADAAGLRRLAAEVVARAAALIAAKPR